MMFIQSYGNFIYFALPKRFERNDCVCKKEIYYLPGYSSSHYFSFAIVTKTYRIVIAWMVGICFSYYSDCTPSFGMDMDSKRFKEIFQDSKQTNEGQFFSKFCFILACRF